MCIRDRNAPFAGLSGGPTGTPPVTVAQTNTESLTTIPIIIAISSPSYVNQDINMRISPYEPGVLSTAIFDIDGKKVFEQKTTVENKNAFNITLKQPVKTKGSYVIKNTLNDKYTESRKITVD